MYAVLQIQIENDNASIIAISSTVEIARQAAQAWIGPLAVIEWNAYGDIGYAHYTEQDEELHLQYEIYERTLDQVELG